MSPAAVAERPAAAYMRAPAGHRIPEGRLPCKERFALNQSTPSGHTPCQKCCVACGRVTARRDLDGMPWCGGETTEPIGAPA